MQVLCTWPIKPDSDSIMMGHKRDFRPPKLFFLFTICKQLWEHLTGKYTCTVNNRTLWFFRWTTVWTKGSTVFTVHWTRYCKSPGTHMTGSCLALVTDGEAYKQDVGSSCEGAGSIKQSLWLRRPNWNTPLQKTPQSIKWICHIVFSVTLHNKSKVYIVMSLAFMELGLFNMVDSMVRVWHSWLWVPA